MLGSWRLLTALVDDVLTPTSPMHLDSYKDDAEAFQSMGYRFEIHKIKTEDEYILSLKLIARLILHRSIY